MATTTPLLLNFAHDLGSPMNELNLQAQKQGLYLSTADHSHAHAERVVNNTTLMKQVAEKDAAIAAEYKATLEQKPSPESK